MRPYLLALLIGAAALPVFCLPVRLRCEHLDNPLGIDALNPRLSWQTQTDEQNWRQSAYEILVASSTDLLRPRKADVWDSGKQASGESVGIGYGGPALQSRKRYWWTVRVWDSKGHVSESTQPAWFEMGLLNKQDWSGKWIYRVSESSPEKMHWIWVAGQDATKVQPGTEVEFRTHFFLPEAFRSAAVSLVARGDWKLEVNGHEAGEKMHWGIFDWRDISGFVHPGENTLRVLVKSPSDKKTVEPAALMAALTLTDASGKKTVLASDDHWQARLLWNTDWTPASGVGDVHTATFGDPGELPQPASLLRRTFDIRKPVKRARLYATALGAYEAYLNGKRIGDDQLTPGFTQFEKRVQYQTYDVTKMLSLGGNTVAAMLGPGWFASGLTWTGNHFGIAPPARLLAQLEIDYEDGSHDIIASNDQWKTSESPVVQSEIYDGETYDARLEQSGWADSQFDDAAWQHATEAAPYPGEMSAETDIPQRVVMHVKPEKLSAAPDGAYVFDMGQNMVGWATLKVNGPAGTRVQLRFAEILNPDGSIYTTNLRDADATDTYILRGGGEENWHPRFTFHGFRYVEVTGYPGKPDLNAIDGEVISSVSGDPTMHIDTASQLVNHMWQLGIWGQRGNFLSVPTDCPQRDERLGWMADAAVFWRTGSYNFNTAAFTNNWLRDVRDAQRPNGSFSNVSPTIAFADTDGAPGWADAGVIVPWTAWIQYGDSSVIDRNWDAMQRYMKFIADANPDFIRAKAVGPDFADWLAPDPSTPKPLTDTAYWAYSAQLMEQMARGTGRNEDAQHYADLYTHIRDAFQHAFVKSDGTVGSGSQTSYVLALQMKLLPPEMEAHAVNELVKNIQAHNNHLTTGFLGTPWLLFTLANHGRSDVAYSLLLNDTYPSWGYMIRKGATTWWERWNGDTGDPAMNSYNHYAFGSVMAWVYQCVAGIDTTTSGAGFHQITIHPRPDPKMPHGSGVYESAYGTVLTDWTTLASGALSLKVTVPPNTTAKVILPPGHTEKDGKPAGNDPAGIEIGSGTYNFEVR